MKPCSDWREEGTDVLELSSRVLVTGAGGMLGVAVCSALRTAGHQVVASGVEEADRDLLTLDVRNWDDVRNAVSEVRPSMVIHLAAETDVDRCEREPDHAYATNAIGTENIAVACQGAGASVVYVSTANVFDGSKPTPYCEYDATGSLNTYGRTKLEGEEAVRRSCPRHFILRAGWMVGGWEIDKKFVYKIVQLCRAKSELRVVSDKYGSLTFTEDFARNLLPLLRSGRYGLYHMANHGTGSRADIAKEIVAALGMEDEILVHPVSSDEFPLPAPRPRSEMLRNMKLQLLGLDEMPDWRSSLRRYIAANRDKQ